MANPNWKKGMKCPGVPIQEQVKKTNRIRTHLTRKFSADLLQVWKEHGLECLYKLAREDAAAFVKAAGLLIPKMIDKTVTEVKEVHEMTTAEILERLEKIREREKNDGLH